MDAKAQFFRLRKVIAFGTVLYKLNCIVYFALRLNKNFPKNFVIVLSIIFYIRSKLKKKKIALQQTNFSCYGI